jgi:hypothetical protein
LQTQILLADGQDGRRIGQTMRYADFSHGIAQCGFQTLNQTFFGLGDFF